MRRSLRERFREGLSDARRWVGDVFSSDTQNVGNPKVHWRNLQRSLHELTPEERLKQYNHINAYTAYYYNGIHSEGVPRSTDRLSREAIQNIERLNRVDQARITLEQLGGPPTKQTIQDAVERSAVQREAGRVENQMKRQNEATPENERSAARVTAKWTEKMYGERILAGKDGTYYGNIRAVPDSPDYTWEASRMDGSLRHGRAESEAAATIAANRAVVKEFPHLQVEFTKLQNERHPEMARALAAENSAQQQRIAQVAREASTTQSREFEKSVVE